MNLVQDVQGTACVLALRADVWKRDAADTWQVRVHSVRGQQCGGSRAPRQAEDLDVSETKVPAKLPTIAAEK